MKAVTGLVRLVERVVALSAVMAEGVAAYGGEVTPERAVNATSAWIARSNAPARLPTGEVRTFSMNGTNAFHLVALRGGGWAAQPADDAAEPLLAFCLDEDAALPDTDDGCPGWGFLAYCAGMDVLTSLHDDIYGEEAFENGYVCGSDRPSFTITTSMAIPQKTVRYVPSAQKAASAQSLTWESIDAGTDVIDTGVTPAVRSKSGTKSATDQFDIRVPSFVKSRWGQSKEQSKYCFDYHTPNHSVCGCVATAMAQVMRHFEWPASNVVMPITSRQCRISYDGTPIYTNILNGAFNWSKMPYDPRRKSNLSDEECEMIGRLTFDCGISLGMNYKPGGSSPRSVNGGKSTRAGLRDDFGYGFGCYEGNVSAANIKNTILPSLDARRPASCSIPGHMVVADGYAFQGGELYIHLNMGWCGTSDAYYSAFGGSSKRRIGSAHYNLTTNGTVRIASGRVTDQTGAPLPGVTVNAKVLMSGETTPTSQVRTTDDCGIYAIETSSGSYDIDISVEMDGYTSLRKNRTTSTSSDDTGNSWGNDFVLVSTNNTFAWIGGGDGTTFGDANNWNRGIAPTNGATLVFGAAAPAFVTNDIPSFAPASVVFSPECPGIEVGGLGFDGIGAMVSSAPERPVIATETVFADTINVSGDIDFSGGVWGTYPVNHGVYYGDYHLTTENWWHPPARATVPAGSALYVKNYEGSSPESLVIEKGGEVVVDCAKISGAQGYLLTRNQGKFTARNGLAANSTEIDRLVNTSYEDDRGTFDFYSLSGANDVPKYLPPDFTYIIGEGGISGSLWRSYRDYSINLSPRANYAITGTIGDYANNSSANPLVLSLEDIYGNPSMATVTDSGALVGGTLQVRATGSGVFRIANDRCTFGAGLFVVNGATLELAPGCSPGSGNVTFYSGTALALAASRDAVALVRGTFAVVATGADGSVSLRFGNGTESVPVGKYTVVYADGGISQSVADAFMLSNPILDGATARFEVVDSKVLVLTVEREGEEAQWVPLRDGIWIGNGNDRRFSNSANWLGGSVPANGASLILPIASDTTLVCDIPNFAPQSIAFSGDSGRIVITASNSGSITNIERILNSATGKHHVFNLPVSFKDGETADIAMDADHYMDFAGGMTAYTVKKTDGDVYYCGNVALTKDGEDWSNDIKDYAYIVAGSTLSLPAITNSGGRNFRIEDGAAVQINGDYTLVLPPEEDDVEQEVENRFITSYNAGTLEVTGRIISSGMCRLTASYWNAAGVIIANGLLSASNGDCFCLNGDVNEAVSAKWVIGAEGLEAASLGFWVLHMAETTVSLYPRSDYAINASMGVRKPLTIGTTDFFDASIPRTVTINGNLYRDGSVTVTGIGTAVFNSASEFTGGLTVSDAATLRLGAGAQPGAGSVTMAAGTTLAVPGMETLSKPCMSSLSITGSGTVKVRVNNGTELIDSRVPLITFATAPDVATLEDLEIENPTSVANPYFYMDGNVLMLYAGDKIYNLVDLCGETISTTNLGGSINGTALNGNTVVNGVLNVTGNQYFADGTFTFGTGLTLNQKNEQWGVSGGRTVKIVDGCTVNHMSGNDIFFGRYKDGSTWKSFNSNATQLILDNGTLNSDGQLCFSPIADNNSKSKSHVINFTMVNNSVLTLDAINDKELRFGEVTAGNSQKVNYLKLTASITNSTITAKQIRIGQKNSYITDKANSFNKIIFGPGTVLNVGQVYSYAYPAPTVVLDGVKLCWMADKGDSILGQNNGVTTRIYTIGPKGLVIDKQSGYSRTIVSNMASALSGSGGITKTGPGDITWNTARVGESTIEPMTFTGPLVVSNGTWTSTLDYAACAFAVDGACSKLALSGALSAANVLLSATDGGTLTLAGATIADSKPDLTLAGGGTTDIFSGDNTVATYTIGTLALGADALLTLTGGGMGVDAVSADSVALSATAVNPVALKFTDAANIPDGAYAILTIIGGGEFSSGDEAKFVLDANAPAGASLSVSGASLVLIVKSADTIPVMAADASAATVNAAVDGVGFVDAAVKVVIGGSAEEYNAFKSWANGVMGATGDALAGEAAVVANAHAAAAYLLGAGRLFENEPTVEIAEMAIGDGTSGTGGTSGTENRGTMTVAVTVRDGDTAVAVDAAKVAAMFEVTGDLGDWTGAAKLTPTVTTSITDASGKMTFVVTPGDGTANRAFLRIKR